MNSTRVQAWDFHKVYYNHLPNIIGCYTVESVNETRLAALSRDWEDFTDLHKEAREVSERSIKVWLKFISGASMATDSAPPVILAGSFGSGKTQLLFHLFKYGWGEKVPVLYVTLTSLVNALQISAPEGGYTPEGLVMRISELIRAKLEEIYNALEHNLIAGTVSDLWLPVPEGHSLSKVTPKDVFEISSIDPYYAKTVIFETLNYFKSGHGSKKGVVLLIDEMEMAYQGFRKLFVGGAGIRDFTELVARGNTDFYAVMAVSYLSYYELFLSEFVGDSAYGRRVRLVSLPPLSPDNVFEHLQKKGKERLSNTFWWFSRGRLGWIASLEEVIPSEGREREKSWLLSFPETYAPRLKHPLSEGMPIMDLDELKRLEDRCGSNDDCKAALRFFLLDIRPHKLNGVPPFVSTLHHQRGQLQNIERYLLWASSLVPLEGFLDKFLDDFRTLCNTYDTPLGEEETRLLRDVLTHVLSSMAYREGSTKSLCVGAPEQFMANEYARDYVQRVLDIVTSYLVEFYGTDDRVRRLSEALYRISSLTSSDEVWGKAGTWTNVRNLFLSNSGREWVVVSPSVLLAVFPLYLSNPIISDTPLSSDKLDENLTKLLNSGVDDFLDIVSEVSDWLMPQKHTRDSVVYFVPLPRKTSLDDFQLDTVINGLLELIKKHKEALVKGTGDVRKLFIVLAGGSDKELLGGLKEKASMTDAQVSLLLDDLKRISIVPLPSERLKDFVRSLAVLSMRERAGGIGSLEVAISKLSVAVKKRADYFASVLKDWLNEFTENSHRERREYIRGLLSGTPLSAILVKDLETIGYVYKRTSKYTPRKVVLSLLFVSLPEESKSPILKMRASLDSGLVKVQTLPSIYQEFVGRRSLSLSSAGVLSRNPVLVKLYQAALSEKHGSTFEDILSFVLDDPHLPFFGDFKEVLLSSLELEPETGATDDKLIGLYRVLLLHYLSLDMKDDILSSFNREVQSVESRVNELLHRLETIKDVSRQLCNNTPICPHVKIPHKKLSGFQLEDEVRGIKGAIEIFKGWARDPRSDNQVLGVSFVTIFGRDGEGSGLLLDLKNSLDEWIQALNNGIYEPLNKLLATFQSLPEVSGLESGGYKVEIVVEGKPEAAEKGRETLEEIIGELEELKSRYQTYTNDLENSINSVESILGRVKDQLKKLESKISGIGGSDNG